MMSKSSSPHVTVVELGAVHRALGGTQMALFTQPHELSA